MKSVITAIALLAVSSPAAYAVTLAGDSIDAAMIRTIDTGYGLGRIHGYGLEAPFTVVDGASDEQQYSSAFKLDVDGSGFRIRFISMAGWQEGTVLRLSDLDFSAPGTSSLTGLAVDTNLSGYALVLGTDSVEIHLGGTHFTPATYLEGRFVVSGVPEPATHALMALGLAGVAGAVRRTRSGGKRV